MTPDPDTLKTAFGDAQQRGQWAVLVYRPDCESHELPPPMVAYPPSMVAYCAGQPTAAQPFEPGKGDPWYTNEGVWGTVPFRGRYHRIFLSWSGVTHVVIPKGAGLRRCRAYQRMQVLGWQLYRGGKLV